MPLLPLDSWRKYLGYNPFHFWGLQNELVPVTSACNSLVRQYAWQHVDTVGREEIKQAIQSAEDRLRDYLGYAVAPRYAEKTLPFPHYGDAGVWRYGFPYGADGRMIPVDLYDGYVQAIGVEKITSLGDAPVTISDEDADGLDDTFVATLATTETDATKLAVYFIAADRLDNESLSEKWRIQPVSISISAGTATVRGRSWLLVQPIKYEGFNLNKDGFDPNAAATYVTSIHLAVRETDPNGETLATSQAVLLWETLPCTGWWGCCDNSSLTYTGNVNDPGAEGRAIARVGIRDAKNGIILPAQAIRNATTGEWTAASWSGFREPDRVTVRYLAGQTLVDGQMTEKWRTIVARLAAAELARRICACDEANQELYHWQFDLGRAAGANDEQYSISPPDLDNPLGTRRGQVWAWKQIRNLRLGKSVLV